MIRISAQEYAQEIADDLDKLLAEYPAGIYISHLQDYYGESIARTHKACRILEERKAVSLNRSASGAYYILPIGYNSGVDLPELTQLQRKLTLYLLNLCQKHNTQRVKTNYSQLSREMQCSYGGLRACIKRLADLTYLKVETPSLRGKQDKMIIFVEVDILTKETKNVDN